MYRPSWLKCRLTNLSVYQSSLFIIKMVFQFQYTQQEIISLLERVRVRVRWPIIPFHYGKWYFALDIPPVKYHLASKTYSVIQTYGTISSPHLGFGIQIIPSRKIIEAPTRHDDIRMTSNKVCDDFQRRWGDVAIQNIQWKSDKLLSRVPTARWVNSVLSFDFRYENDIRPWMFEQRRVWRQRIFFAGLILWLITRRVITCFSSGLIPYYKSFSLWK